GPANPHRVTVPLYPAARLPDAPHGAAIQAEAVHIDDRLVAERQRGQAVFAPEHRGAALAAAHHRGHPPEFLDHLAIGGDGTGPGLRIADWIATDQRDSGDDSIGDG